MCVCLCVRPDRNAITKRAIVWCEKYVSTTSRTLVSASFCGMLDWYYVSTRCYCSESLLPNRAAAADDDGDGNDDERKRAEVDRLICVASFYFAFQYASTGRTTNSSIKFIPISCVFLPLSHCLHALASISFIVYSKTAVAAAVVIMAYCLPVFPYLNWIFNVGMPSRKMCRRLIKSKLEQIFDRNRLREFILLTQSERAFVTSTTTTTSRKTKVQKATK